MPHTKFTSDEIARRGEDIYLNRVRSLVETHENIGKIVSIDIETGDYEVDPDLLVSGRRLRERRPGAALWTKRIGYNAVYSIGGALTRTAP